TLSRARFQSLFLSLLYFEAKFTCAYITRFTGMQNPLDFKPTPIKELIPGMQSVNCHFIVVEKKPALGFRNALGDFTTIKVADPSGSVNLNVLASEYGECMQPGDICKLKNGHTTMFKGCLALQCGKNGDLSKINEFTMVFSETPHMSDYNSDWASQFPAKGRVPSDDLNSTPAIGAPPRNNTQPLLNLLPPGPPSHGNQQPSSLPRDPRAAKRYHDPRSAAAAAARGDQ
ncbi:hypothetical protein PMAYCL1PPCAC_18996, partial [Pristionchus mayeri]